MSKLSLPISEQVMTSSFYRQHTVKRSLHYTLQAIAFHETISNIVQTLYWWPVRLQIHNSDFNLSTREQMLSVDIWTDCYKSSSQARYV